MNLAANNPGLPEPNHSKFHCPSRNGDLQKAISTNKILLQKKQKRTRKLLSLDTTYVVGLGVGFSLSRLVILSFTSICCKSVVFPVTNASKPPESLN